MKAEELLAPEDIKITYSEAVEAADQSQKNFEPSELRHPVASLTQDRNAYDNFEAWNRMYGDERAGAGAGAGLAPEPPRVLPSAEKDEVTTMEPEKSGGKWRPAILSISKES